MSDTGNPFDLSEPGDTLEGRLEGETLARGLMDGRKPAAVAGPNRSR